MAKRKAKENPRAKWPGLPERLENAFARAGYWNEKRHRPAVLQFSLKHSILAGYIYKWLAGDAVPDRENLYRIADALNVSPAWLLFGDDRPAKPISGGSDADLRHYVNHVVDRFYRWWYRVHPSNRWAVA